MKIADPSQTTLVNEVKLMLEALPFDGARVLELGCGRAEKTRTLAETGRPRKSSRWRSMQSSMRRTCRSPTCR